MIADKGRAMHPPMHELAQVAPGTAGGPRQWLAGLVAQWWPVAALAMIALAIRLPHLAYVPQFTDEVLDAQVSYGIYSGKRPLIGSNAYTGAFHYYVQAGLFWLFGPSVDTPRSFVMVLGVGAVVATYGLGTEIGRRAAPATDARAVRRAGLVGGLVAGGLLATNAIHVVTNSHLAWPHCTLLLYLTGAFWLLERALRLGTLEAGGGASLVGVGLAFGLAQQQHPTMLLLWPVFLGYVAWRGRPFFRTCWAYMALVAFVVGISPLVVYNVQTGLGSLKESEEQRAAYEEGRAKDFSYRGRAAEIALTLARLPASAIDRRPVPEDQPIRGLSYLTDPSVILYSALSLAGLVAAARLGAFGPALAVAAFALLLPFFPASHDNLPRQGRYLMPLLPLAFAGVGGLAAIAWGRVATTKVAALVASVIAPPHEAHVGASVRMARGDPTARQADAVSAARSGRAGAVARTALVVALGSLVLYPLVPLASYYDRILAAGETNSRYYVTLAAAERQRLPGEWVVLDPSLQNDRPGAAGTALRTFDFMLDMREIPHATLHQSSDRIESRVSGDTLLMIADQRPGSATTRANAATWATEELANDDGGGFTLWRLTRR